MFDNLLRELRALERRSITVPIDSDEKGYIDKECPSTNCEFQFKIKDEDWKNICRDEGVWCPMCGHAAPAKSWFTKGQVRHAERHAHRVIESTIDGAMRADARAFNGRQPRNSLISMSMKIGGAPHFTPHRVPAAASAAMELEIACEKCTCRFAVIGSAYFCPACGHSSVDRMFDDSLRKIRAKKDNVDVVRDAIAASAGRDEAELMCRSLIESCLQDGVTAFQRCCEGLYASTGPATPAPMNAFQRLAQGSELWAARVGITYADILGAAELERFGVVGILQNFNTERTNVLLGKKSKLLWGRDTMEDELDGLKFKLSLGSFFQVNPYQSVKLYSLVADWVKGESGLIVDAYSGNGGIALWLTRAGHRVLGIDEFAPAIEDAKESAELNGLSNCRFEAGTLESRLEALQQESIGTLIVDPPRKGLSKEVVEAIPQLSPKRLVYVSCNPATLARDLALLPQYAIQDIRVIDMFPQTPHIETAVLLGNT